MAHKILMIDDDKEMVQLGSMILEREGFQVLGAYSGMEGFAILNKEAGNVDLILLDIMMIDMDGWDILETLKNDEEYKHIPIIMLTARHYLKDEGETTYYEDFFDAYVVKPFAVRDLLGSINRIIQGKEKEWE